MACMAFGTQFTIISIDSYLEVNTNLSRSCWEFVLANYAGYRVPWQIYENYF